jgi:hypothetical protein
METNVENEAAADHMLPERSDHGSEAVREDEESLAASPVRSMDTPLTQLVGREKQKSPKVRAFTHQLLTPPKIQVYRRWSFVDSKFRRH